MSGLVGKKAVYIGTGELPAHFTGELVTIVDIIQNVDMYTIQFENIYGEMLHNAGGRGRTNRCWSVSKSQILVLEENNETSDQEDIEPDAEVTISDNYFKVEELPFPGKRVKYKGSEDKTAIILNYGDVNLISLAETFKRRNKEVLSDWTITVYDEERSTASFARLGEVEVLDGDIQTVRIVSVTGSSKEVYYLNDELVVHGDVVEFAIKTAQYITKDSTYSSTSYEEFKEFFKEYEINLEEE